METLQQRKDEYGLNFELWCDSLGYTERVFCELHGAKEHWARCPKSNVLLFDPTFGTNQHGLKLCCFVSISATGRNTILAFVLIEIENKESFEWSFRCFAKAFRTPPQVFGTDGDQEIERAVDLLTEEGEIRHGTHHILCVYHISQKLHKHLRKLFG